MTPEDKKDIKDVVKDRLDYRNDLKETFKEAVKEWLDDRFATFGKWTFAGLCTLLFAWLIYGLMALNGWHR